MMTGGMSCGKTFRSTEPQADKKRKTVYLNFYVKKG